VRTAPTCRSANSPMITSHVVLDHYKIENNPALVKQEFFPNGKKVYPEKQACSTF